MLGDPRAVIDLGCGLMTLEEYLPAGTAYIPVDVVRRDERTIVIDLNRQPLPDLHAPAIVGLGLLEYIFDVPALLARIARLHRTVILSYNGLAELPDMAIRTGHAWVTHFTTDELEAMFAAAGLTVQARERLDGTQTIWRLSSPEFSSSED